ncbi:hypothetical protein MMC25_007937 [Agyrium rufum]|nr:hypothetical protein [Agyrium rufum]
MGTSPSKGSDERFSYTRLSLQSLVREYTLEKLRQASLFERSHPSITDVAIRQPSPAENQIESRDIVKGVCEELQDCLRAFQELHPLISDIIQEFSDNPTRQRNSDRGFTGDHFTGVESDKTNGISSTRNLPNSSTGNLGIKVKTPLFDHRKILPQPLYQPPNSVQPRGFSNNALQQRLPSRGSDYPNKRMRSQEPEVISNSAEEQTSKTLLVPAHITPNENIVYLANFLFDGHNVGAVKGFFGSFVIDTVAALRHMGRYRLTFKTEADARKAMRKYHGHFVKDKWLSLGKEVSCMVCKDNAMRGS